MMNKPHIRAMLREQAIQDQQITAAANWILRSDTKAVADFWNTLNDAGPDDIRRMADDHLHILRSMAMIGFFECLKSCVDRGTVK